MKVKIPYTKENGNKKKIRLKSIKLAPREIHKVDMQEVRQLKNVEVAGIEIKHTGRKGSVIAVAQSISQSKTHVFRTLLWDILGHRSSTGDYPVDISGTSNSIAYIKNATNREQKYLTYLVHGNQEVYTLGIKTLAPNETVKIDVKKLRDKQIPDIWEKTLPTNLTKAQISWTGLPSEENKEATIPDTLGIIGQMSSTNESKGINSAYFCESCCTGSYETGSERISPVNKTIVYGDQSSIDYDVLVDVVSTCYPTPVYIPTPINASWTSGDPNIGTFSGDDLSIQGAGKTTVQASFQFQQSYIEPCGGGGGPFFANLTETRFLKSFFNSEEVCNNGIRKRGPNAEMPEASFIETKKKALAPGCDECNYSNVPITLQTQVTVKPKIQIKRNSNDITGTTQNVVVGDKIDLTTTVQDGPQSNKQWEIAGAKNAGFQHTLASGGEILLNASSLQNENVTFFWKDSGNNEVKYTTSIRGATNSATATFNVKKPLVSLGYNKGVVHVGPDIFSSNPWHLSYGDVNITNNLQPGMKFTKSIDSNNQVTGGDYVWVQIVNLNRRYASGGQWYKSVKTGLDSSFPYTSQAVFEDSPEQGLVLPHTNNQAKDSFSLYLMYKHNSTNAIYVPLKKATWTWCGKAARSGANWDSPSNLESSSSPNPAPVAVDYPSWNQLVSRNNVQWTTTTSGDQIQCQ